jgi:hypothetical protein
MKSAIKSAWTAARRAFAWYQVRILETNLAGMIDTLPLVRDEDTSAAMRLSIAITCKELCRARANYNALLPAGQRRTWTLA